MKLTHHKLHSLLRYKRSSGEFIWLVSRGRVKAGTVAGTMTRGYVIIRIFGKLYPAHRLAWFYVHKEWPKEKIDHIKRETSNNRMSQLREATHSQNNHNKCVRRDSSSGLKCVRRRGNRWNAYIVINGKRTHLGYFRSPQKASAAYAKAAKQHFGKYARIK